VEISILVWVIVNSLTGTWDELVSRVEIANAIFYLGFGTAILTTVDILQFCLICGCMRRKIHELSKFKSVINLNRETLAEVLLLLSEDTPSPRNQKTPRRRHRTAIKSEPAKITEHWKIYEMENPYLAYLICYNTNGAKPTTTKELLI